MKKFEVYFFSENKGEKERAMIYAESQIDAMQKFIVGKEANNFSTVVVSPASFIDSILSTHELFPNPLYKLVDKKQHISKTNDAAINSLASDNLNRSTEVFGGIRDDKLDKLIELQEKQLYWIRIIGIQFLFAAIGTLLALIIRAFN